MESVAALLFFVLIVAVVVLIVRTGPLRRALEAEQAAHRVPTSVVVGGVDLEATVQLAVAKANERTASDRDTAVLQQVQQLSTLVQQLGERTAQKFGDVDRAMQMQAEAATALQSTTASLRDALAHPNARGQWGERMADDVLRLAGLLPNVNYHKRTAVEGEGRVIPDFTFFMPDQHVLFMDVKFPIDAYLQYLQADTDAERQRHRDAFLAAVRGHVRELARRDYAGTDDRPAVQNVLMFVPNETIVGFIHEQSPGLIDEAMREHVVLCSPLTLFAFIGVIRQAFDSFRVEQASREMLALLGKFGTEWRKYTEQVERVKRQFDTVNRNFELLATTRRRGLERPLEALDRLRQQEGIAIDTESFASPDPLDEPPLGEIEP